MVVAGPHGRRARRQIVQRLIGRHAHTGVQKRHINVLSTPCATALMHGCQNGCDRIDAGENIRRGNARALRLAIGFAGDRHQPAHALNDIVIARAMRIGAVLTETGDRTIDQARIDLAQAVIVHAVFGQTAHLEVFNQDIRITHQFAHMLLTFLGRQINRDRGFAAIARMEIRRRRLAVVFNERRPPAARIIPARGFDLDHFRTQIRQRLTGPRAGQNACQFDNLQPFKRALRCRNAHSLAAIFSSRVSANSA